MSGFSIIFFLLQITTIFNNQYSSNTIVNYFFLTISLLIIFELLLNNHLFAYYVVVILKTIVFIIVFKYLNITVNGFFAFPLMQICFLYYHFSQYFYDFRFSIIIHIITFLFLFLLYYIIKQYTNNHVLLNSIFIFAIIYLIINCFKYFYIDKRFTIHITTAKKFIGYIQSFNLPVSGLLLLSLTYLPFIDNSYLIIKIIFVFTIIIPLFIEITNFFVNKKAFNLEFKISWGFLIIYFSIILLINYILHINISNELYQKVINNTLNIIIPLAILNITALFILLQMNLRISEHLNTNNGNI